jgi:Lrp/AsnC family leucine-responsive transcriptional regulator
MGVLAGYRAVVPPARIGLGVSALVGVFTREGVDQDDVAAALRSVAAIEDCWAVAGDETFLVKVRTADVDALEQTLVILRRTPGVARTRTTVVLSTTWEGRLPPPA